MGKHKTVKETATFRETLEAAKCDTEGLAEEIRSWEENMSGTGLENTSKYQDVSECADALEEVDWDFVNGIIEEFEKNEALKVKLDETVETVFSKPYSKMESRPTRLARVLASLEAVKEKMESIKDELDAAEAEADDEEEEDGKAVLGTTDPEEDDISAYFDDWLSDFDEAISNLEGVCFPGMF